MNVIFDNEKAIADLIDDPECHFLPAPAFSVRDGFAVHYNLGNSLFSCARDEAVRQYPVPGRLWHWFPKTGRFYIGFVLIDDRDRPFAFDVHIQKQWCMTVTADRADGLRHIYFTDEAYDLEYAQTVELLFAGDGSRQAVEGLVFLSEAPAARLARQVPPRVSRQAADVENPPLAEFFLVNPCGFRLRQERLRLPVPAAWPPDARLVCGGRELPYALVRPGLVEVLVDGIGARRRAVRVVEARDSAPAAAHPTLSVHTGTDGITLQDAHSHWCISLADGGFQVRRGETGNWLFLPVLESEDADGAGAGGELRLLEATALSAAVEVRFNIAGFLHSTTLRFVAGSARIEFEHLLENHVKAPFARLRRYGLRIVAEAGADQSVRAINETGATRAFYASACRYHTEQQVATDQTGLRHSLQWAGGQFTLQEMAWSAPVGLCAIGTALDVELLPPADLVQPDPDEEYRIRNQFFLENGQYKLREGMARRHFSCLCTDAPAAPAAVLYEANRLDEPAFLHVACWRDGRRLVVNPSFAAHPLYRNTVQRWVGQYLANREAVRAFGFFSYGDWFGERVSNWGNNEYDTPYAFLLNFLATGDPVLRRLGLAAARHQMDVDTYHGEHEKAGWQITHSMAHGGRYFPDEYRIGAYAHGGVGVAHSWVEGMLLYWRLTGDGRACDIARRMLDDLATAWLKNWAFTTGRDAGWHLIHLCAGYRELGDQRYLDAAAELVDKILARQRRDGSFRRVLYSDHCLCYPKHTGEVSFMMGFLLEGLKRFHTLTGDPLVGDAITALARSVIDEMWDAETETFRYTSCPASNPLESAMMLEGLSYAARLSGDLMLRTRCRKELRKIAKATVSDAVVAGRLVYGDGACGKLVSQRLRMFADVCRELLQGR